jgi:hypothetical protein
MPVAASREPKINPIELRLSDMVVAAYDAIIGDQATPLDYRVLAASDAFAALEDGTAFSNDLFLAANDALVAANQALNLCFSDSFGFLDSVTLVPA